ncbi:hypothetical protein PF008_g17927 [Phytophthora fragariae]|uniref:Uncharacterized protein n=1 Tax=Phytophthora fragariae TaxID=53985 RepID=A0A6G0R6V4_9STRA|nr:hypothetical protein PF008_g17927 [Phytophthora fragariae]
MSYAVLSFVKCSEKLHIGATTRTRPARLLERLRRQRGNSSCADWCRHGVQHRARVARRVVCGADLPEERQEHGIA